VIKRDLGGVVTSPIESGVFTSPIENCDFLFRKGDLRAEEKYRNGGEDTLAQLLHQTIAHGLSPLPLWSWR
jgi:hypothetical protein